MNGAQRRLQQWIQLQSEREPRLGEDAPTPAQCGVLFYLGKSDGATMSELAEALELVPSAISGLVQRMEASGWVTRSASADDGRSQRVWMTPAATELLPTLLRVNQRINGQLTQGFSDEELATVARWLSHVRNLES